MRLDSDQIQIIREVIHKYDPQAEILLFGSRVNDKAKGGDIDLLCFSGAIDRRIKRLIRREMSDRLNGQRIDLMVSPDRTESFVRMAMEDAVSLGAGYGNHGSEGR